MDVDNVCIDWMSSIVTTPAYMKGDARPHEVYDGVSQFVRKVTSIVQQNNVVKEITHKKA